MKTGGNLAGEITHINKNKDESRDISSAANSVQLAGAAADNNKDTSWEKPAWTQNAGLKSTAKGKGGILRECSFSLEQLRSLGNFPFPISNASFCFIFRPPFFEQGKFPCFQE